MAQKKHQPGSPCCCCLMETAVQPLGVPKDVEVVGGCTGGFGGGGPVTRILTFLSYSQGFVGDTGYCHYTWRYDAFEHLYVLLCGGLAGIYLCRNIGLPSILAMAGSVLGAATCRGLNPTCGGDGLGAPFVDCPDFPLIITDFASGTPITLGCESHAFCTATWTSPVSAELLI